MRWIYKLFDPLATYSPRQRRGFLLLIPAVCLLLAAGEFWRAYKIRQIPTDTTDYRALRQWVVDLQDSLALAAAAAQTESFLEDCLEKIPKEDLNAATALELQRVHGIGVVLSRRIILYREALGGFHSWTQLTEVRGLHTRLWVRLRRRYVLHPVASPLHINRLSPQVLRVHPYVSDSLAAQIFAERPFANVDELQARVSLPAEYLYHLRPYLSFVP